MEFKQLLDKAYLALGRREYAAHELQLKLSALTEDSGLVTQVLDYLREHNLQSDERFAECAVKSYIARGMGPVKIALLLQDKKIAQELIDKYLHQAEHNWEELAKKVLNKKFMPEDLTSLKNIARAQNFLAYRGFKLEHFTQHL